MATIKWAVLLLLATSAGAAAPDTSSELLMVRTVNIRSTQKKWSLDQAVELRQKLDEVVPILIPDPSDGADLMIEYEESITGTTDADRATTWRATLFRLACQSREFGEPPSRIVRGKCENNLFVRIGMGKLSGAVPIGRSAKEDFASALRDAIFGFAPANKAPVAPPPVAPVPVPAPPQPAGAFSSQLITSEPSVPSEIEWTIVPEPINETPARTAP